MWMWNIRTNKREQHRRENLIPWGFPIIVDLQLREGEPDEQWPYFISEKIKKMVPEATHYIFGEPSVHEDVYSFPVQTYNQNYSRNK
jgi:hypothetical protein